MQAPVVEEGAMADRMEGVQQGSKWNNGWGSGGRAATGDWLRDGSIVAMVEWLRDCSVVSDGRMAAELNLGRDGKLAAGIQHGTRSYIGWWTAAWQAIVPGLW